MLVNWKKNVLPCQKASPLDFENIPLVIKSHRAFQEQEVKYDKITKK